MGIDAVWITENGEPKEQVFDSRQHLSRLAASRWHKLADTKCLQFLEPWGDAIFNQSQVPHLLQELRSELAEVPDSETRLHVEKVIHLVEKAVDQTHTYIKFIGD